MSACNPDVSVAILTRNSERSLEACLESVIQEKPGQILAVDMGSTDRTLSILKQYGVEIVHNPSHSLGYSRRLAVQMARHSFLMFVDSDVILTPHCISELVSELRRLGWSGIHASVLSARNETYWQRAEDAKYLLYFNGMGLRNDIGAAAALFKREILLKYPFDQCFVESCEDIDLFLRLSRAGQKLGVSYSIAYHEHRRQFREFARQRFRGGLGVSRLALKYRSGRMLISPLTAMVSYSLHSLLRARIWLIPYWIADGVCRFIGVVVGVHNRKTPEVSLRGIPDIHGSDRDISQLKLSENLNILPATRLSFFTAVIHSCCLIVHNKPRNHDE